MTLRPVFLLSMPRSGSTLLQSILSSHPDIATAPEPWFLLSLAGLRDATGSHARYNATIAQRAFTDLDRVAAERGGSIDHAIRAFTLEAYQQLADDRAKFFLDKTPRYAAIADWLREIFPDAAFVVLWRDPRDVIASMIRTWGGGRWNVFLYEYDLYAGARSLATFARDPSVLSVTYEDLVASPEITLKLIDDYLELDAPIAQHAPDDANFDLVVGAMGDPTGLQRYGATMSTESVGSWRSAFEGRIRSRWLSRYVSEVFPGPFGNVPYSAETMQREIKANVSRTFDDPTDAALVPLTRIWPSVNDFTGFRAEESVRAIYERVKSRR